MGSTVGSTTGSIDDSSVEGRPSVADLLRASAVWTVSILTLHAFLEWLFFATKLSFLTPLGVLEKLTVLFVGPVPLLLAALALWSAMALLTLPWVLTRRRPSPATVSALKILFALVPSFLLACGVLILIDNFTYTVVGFGSITARGFGLQIYAVLFWGLFGGALLFLIDRLACPVVGLWRIIPAVALAGCVGLMVTLFEDGIARLPVEVGNGGIRKASERHLPDIFLISSDGLEAAHLPVYGGPGETPFLSHLSRESLVFENVFTNSNRTGGSVPSALGGRYPATTHKLTADHALSGRDAYIHLPGLLRQHGYAALQLGPRVHVDAHAWNMRQAFHRFNRARPRQLPLEALADRSDGRLIWEFHFTEAMIGRVWRRLLHIFRIELMENPAFANLDIAALESDAVATFLDNHPGPVFVQAHFMMTRTGAPAEVAEFDSHVGALVDALRRRGRWENTIFVVWSDHGVNHGIRERLPLLVRLPYGRQPAVDLSSNAQNLDIPPTVLDALAQPIPEWMEGSSLLRSRTRRRPIFIIQADDQQHGKEWNGHTMGGPLVMGMVVCDQLYELDLFTDQLTSRSVRGHSAPCVGEPAAAGSRARQTVQQLLRDHLTERGYSLD